MKVLVACEYSGVVRDAFIRKGHDAMSCDLLPSESNFGPHYQGDIRDIIDDEWDLLIAHPPCTYLCVPGAHYLHKQPDRWGKMLEAKDLFMLFYSLSVPKICIENPVPHKYAQLPKYTQIIQPWQFGHEQSKRTCLWLKGLPPLMPTKIMNNHGERYERTPAQQEKYGRWANSKWYAKSNAHERARTFQGIADALATQYTAFINSRMTVDEWENLFDGLDISAHNAIIDKYVQL